MQNKKIALITGVAGAIGFAVAEQFVKDGHALWLMGRSSNCVDAVAEKLKGHVVGVSHCDLTDTESVKDRVSGILKQTSIHVLVNNAGVTKDGLFMRMSMENWDMVQHVNLRAAFQMMQLIIPSMMRERFGRVVNIASVTGFSGNVGQANYAASKAGLVALSKTVALEVCKRGVTVNCVAPGMIESDMTRAMPKEAHAQWVGKIPVGKIGRPEDVAHAVSFLASEEANYITGQTIHVNGGLYM
ncbi:MAG: 3-oxoacyl-ACP reductase FabG [Alphaproteobacteria bacterium]|nr:3-oxoacyl-ACP reductase FabG [Alphaproteobacteria bacterium]